MASDYLHVPRMPASASISGTVQFNNGRPVVINLASAVADAEAVADAAVVNGNSSSSSNSAEANPTSVPSPLPSVRSLLMSCESSLPFILVILAKLLYDHRLGMHNMLSCTFLFFSVAGEGVVYCIRM